jgi:hypothetical protein
MALSTISQAGLAAPLTLTLPVVATTMGVGGATPSGSGSGITFPATQSASSDANTLDDYEEGTWTPVLSYSGGTPPTYITQNAKYTKIGRVVHLTGYISVSNAGSGTLLRVTGLPFVGSGDYSMMPLWSAGSAVILGYYLGNGSSQMNIGLLTGASSGGSSANIPPEWSVQTSYFTN